MEVEPVGCFGAESALGSDKVYTGGKAGAEIGHALQWAGMKRKKYLAIARAGVDGHAFAFSEPPDVSMALDADDDGCGAPCNDIDQFSCGCADAVCRENGAGALPGEDNARRWLVYEVPQEFRDAAARKAASKKKAGGKSKKTRRHEP